MIIGFSGILGLLLKYIGPLVIASTISLVGMSLFRSVGTFAAPQWGIAILLVPPTNKLGVFSQREFTVLLLNNLNKQQLNYSHVYLALTQDNRVADCFCGVHEEDQGPVLLIRDARLLQSCWISTV